MYDRVWVYLWWSQTVFGECVLLPLKTLVTGSVQNSTKVQVTALVVLFMCKDPPSSHAPADRHKLAAVSRSAESIRLSLLNSYVYAASLPQMVDRTPLHLCLMMLHTVCFFGILVIAPWYLLGGHDAAVLFAGYHFTAGLCFGIFSQVNHLNEPSIQAAYKVSATRSHACPPCARHRSSIQNPGADCVQGQALDTWT